MKLEALAVHAGAEVEAKANILHSAISYLCNQNYAHPSD